MAGATSSDGCLGLTIFLLGVTSSDGLAGLPLLLAGATSSDGCLGLTIFLVGGTLTVNINIIMYTLLLPPKYEVSGKVMFSQVLVSGVTQNW